jgi:Nif-specific regulatory protein
MGPASSATTFPTSSSPRKAPEQLLAVAEAGHELAREGPLPRVLERSLNVLERRLGAERSVLFVRDPARGILEVEAAYGIAAAGFMPRSRGGVGGRVTESGRPIVVPMLRHEPMALSELRQIADWSDAPWSLVSVPVVEGGTTLGALSAYFRELDPLGFGGRLQALEVVASLMAEVLSSRKGPVVKEPKPRVQVASAPARVSAFEYSNMVGVSAAMRQVYEQIGQVARTNATALLRGESGTGKELVAQAIHQNSERALGPFVKFNCAALPDPLFESELFGHERGAFTGALARKKGRFELARGGSLFLDEVGELSPSAQAKLLRVLQFREFERLGGTETLRTDARIVVATNKDLQSAVAEGTFREDLFYRMNVFTITLPALRERSVDIPALAEYFLAKYAVEHNRDVRSIAGTALEMLSDYAWPGNVRELENVIERAIVVCDGGVIQERHLPEVVRRANVAPVLRRTLASAVAEFERSLIEDALRESRGNISRAARTLGATERILRYKAQKYGIDPGRFRD